MKTLLVLSVALVCALAHQSIENTADMNTGISQLNSAKCVCCPKIASSSVIQPLSGYRGNVAIIIGWGDCTPKDGPFEWGVYWGDGIRDRGYHSHHGGNFHVVHQYFKYPKHYVVNAYYCNLSRSCPHCCDDFDRVINVS